MEPRHVLNCRQDIDKFVLHFVSNLPDISDRPDIPPEKVRFWMMDDGNNCRPRKNKKKKRLPRPHSLLKGIKGMDANRAYDFAISQNKWCVTFQDGDGKWVDLVEQCMVCFWLKLISLLVSRSAL